MNFGEALEKLKEGKKITREIWGGYWELSSLESGHGVSFDIIVAHLKDGGIAPAQAYQEDMLAEDWIVVDVWT